MNEPAAGGVAAARRLESSYCGLDIMIFLIVTRYVRVSERWDNATAE